MQSAVADHIVAEHCGLLSLQEQAVTGYRTRCDLLTAQKGMIESEVPGMVSVALTLERARDPVLGMVEVQRSAQAFRESTFLAPVRYPLANDYAFTYELPVEKIIAIIDNKIQTAPPGMTVERIIDSMMDDIVLEIGEEQLVALEEKKERTGRNDTGDNVLDMVMDIRDNAEMGRPVTMEGLDHLVEQVKDRQARNDIGMKMVLEREEMVIGDEMKALDDGSWNARIRESTQQDLHESYKHRVGQLHGAHNTPTKRKDMKAKGLIAVSGFKTMTRDEKYDMYERAWGEGGREEAIRTLDAIAKGRSAPPPESLAGETVQDLAQAFEETVEGIVPGRVAVTGDNERKTHGTYGESLDERTVDPRRTEHSQLL